MRGCSIHDCYNRALTLHGTDRVASRTTSPSTSSATAIFLEDGVETGNVLEHNLGMLTRRASAGQATLPTDVTPATFWITNPDNVVRGNVAAGSDGNGFWYSLPKHPTGLSRSAEIDRSVWPRRTPWAVHGQCRPLERHDGLYVDNGANPPGVTGDAQLRPARTRRFRGMTAYKNRRRGRGCAAAD